MKNMKSNKKASSLGIVIIICIVLIITAVLLIYFQTKTENEKRTYESISEEDNTKSISREEQISRSIKQYSYTHYPQQINKSASLNLFTSSSELQDFIEKNIWPYQPEYGRIKVNEDIKLGEIDFNEDIAIIVGSGVILGEPETDVCNLFRLKDIKYSEDKITIQTEIYSYTLKGVDVRCYSSSKEPYIEYHLFIVFPKTNLPIELELNYFL